MARVDGMRSRKLMGMARVAVGDWLNDFLEHGSECAYVQKRGYRTERWSYGEVARLAFQFARELESRRIRKGERVLIWGENCAEWIAAFLGCALGGAVAVPMDDAAADDFAQRVMREVGARLVVCSHKHERDRIGIASLALEGLRVAVAAHSTAPFTAAAVSVDDPLEIIFTSGTTAEPKGVVITHGNVLANTAPLEAEIRKYLKYERWVHPVRFLNLLPLSHVFGQFLGVFLPPLMAGTVIFQSGLGPAEVLRTIRREQVSVLVAVPRMLQSLKQKVERDVREQGREQAFRMKLERAEGKRFLRRGWIFRRLHSRLGWKFWAFISGGAALDRETEEFWNRLGYAVIQGYGLTETTSLVSVNHPFRLGRGSIGKVLPGREVKLAEDGEILVRGGGVAAGYWMGGGERGSPLASSAPGLPTVGEPPPLQKSVRETSPLRPTDDDGWYRTGDLGGMDAEGNLYFKGRKKDVLVTPAGMNVYPEDLEAALRTQPEVRDCVVVGLARGGNEAPCAVLILREQGVDPGWAVRNANQGLAEYQRMREWFVWPEQDFPRTTTGKPRRNVIGAAVAALRKADPAPMTGASPLADLIGRISGRVPPKLRPESSLEDDLQLSSLERVELMSAIEDRYQLDLSETSFSSARTVGDLEQVLSGKGAARVEYHYPRWTLSWPVRWVRTLAYYVLMRPAIMLLGWPRIFGRENLKQVRGPVLVVCNHIDDVDVGFVQTALPARLRHWLATAAGGEALEALRTPAASRGILLRLCDRLQWVSGVALLNLFPLPRAAAFVKSFSYAGECVDRGYSVLVFPEGHHTTDGKLQPFRAGVGLLATRLGVPVVPMRIEGLFAVKHAGRRFARPGEIRVLIGEAVRFAAAEDPSSIAAELQKRVERLRAG